MEETPIGYIRVAREELRVNARRVLAWVDQQDAILKQEHAAMLRERASQPWWFRWFLQEDDFWASSRLVRKYDTYEQNETALACLKICKLNKADEVLLSIEAANIVFDPDSQIAD